MKAAIEAILFGAGEAVTIAELATALNTDETAAEQAATALAKSYDKERRGLKIIRLNDAFQMCSREEYWSYIAAVTEPRRQQALSPAALETLSIIAYNQPITKSQIELIRGVDSSYSVTRLTERGLVDEAGRADAPGRPILYVTTEEFLRCFGLRTLEDLPKPQETTVSDG